MCLGLFLFREGMRRELNLVRTIERLVVEAEEGKKLKLVTVRGKQKIYGFSEIQSMTPPSSEVDMAGLYLRAKAMVSDRDGVISIKDPENPKSWYNLDTENAVVYEKALIEGVFSGSYDSVDTNDIR